MWTRLVRISDPGQWFGKIQELVTRVQHLVRTNSYVNATVSLVRRYGAVVCMKKRKLTQDPDCTLALQHVLDLLTWASYPGQIFPVWTQVNISDDHLMMWNTWTTDPGTICEHGLRVIHPWTLKTEYIAMLLMTNLWHCGHASCAEADISDCGMWLWCPVGDNIYLFITGCSNAGHHVDSLVAHCWINWPWYHKEYNWCCAIFLICFRASMYELPVVNWCYYIQRCDLLAQTSGGE